MSTVQDLHPQLVTDEAGKTTAVLLPIEEYHLLLEDLDDLDAIIQRRGEPTSRHSELVGELTRAGIL